MGNETFYGDGLTDIAPKVAIFYIVETFRFEDEDDYEY